MKNLLEIKKALNIEVLLLTFTDIFTWSIYNIVIYLMGLYLAMKIDGDVVAIVGIGVGLQYMSRAAVQIPIGLVADRIKKNFDEVFLLMLGITLMGLSTIFLIIVERPIEYYILQIIFGIGVGFNLVTWRKLFAKSINKGKEGISYAVYDTAISLAIAFFGIVGGEIANINDDYFNMVVLIIGIIMLMSNMLVFVIYQNERKK